MFNKAALLSFSLLAIRTLGQQIGTYTTETHPALTFEHCTTASGCTTQSGSVVLDSNWRWVHSTTSSTNCYTGNTWDTTLCPDDVTCAANCALDGADYTGTYGITASGNSLRLNFVTQSSNKNVGSRVYLMAPGSTTEYQGFNLLNQEFAFTVNVANLPCGLNGALYMSEMDLDGGTSRFPTNKAGAQYGTGYCDSQCPRDIKFISGAANAEGWVPDSNNSNAGVGNYGTCCNEMDIWEANSISSAYTPHPCSVDGQTRCTTTACGGSTNRYGSVCDPDGCDFNSYRMGDTTFYGPGETVDTTKAFTVITQFLTDSGTASGNLNEIRRLYIQNGVTIANSYVNVAGIPANTYNSITEAYCDAQKTAFGDTNSFDAQGGFAPLTKAFNHGMVLVLSLWDDYAVDMLWLDSDYPTTAATTKAGVARGTCPTTSGVPSAVEGASASAYVIYSDIRYGDIGSTWGTGSSSGSTSKSSTSSSSSKTSSSTSSTKSSTTTSSTKTTSTSTSTSKTSSASSAGQTLYGQCGGQTWTGPTTCAQGTCTYSNPWYSQCL